jgi:hypothetical protein
VFLLIGLHQRDQYLHPVAPCGVRLSIPKLFNLFEVFLLVPFGFDGFDRHIRPLLI